MPAPEPPVKVPPELQKKQEALQGEAEKVGWGGGGKCIYVILVLSLGYIYFLKCKICEHKWHKWCGSRAWLPDLVLPKDGWSRSLGFSMPLIL